jgi:hypothetical protein
MRKPIHLRSPCRIGFALHDRWTGLHSEAYHASYACPLPAIRIPLRYSDDDLLLPLQNLVNEAYFKGRYGDSINYDLPTEPPLADEEQQSIAAILESASDSKTG